MGNKPRATKKNLKKGTVVCDFNVPDDDNLSRGIVFDNAGYRLVQAVLDREYDRSYICRPSADSPLYCHYPYHTDYDKDDNPIDIDNTAFLEAMGLEIDDDKSLAIVSNLILPLSVIPFGEFKTLVQLFDEKKYADSLKFWD